MIRPLIVLVFVNWLVFALLFCLKVCAARNAPTRRLRIMSWACAAVCGVVFLGASQRLGMQAARAGWLPRRVEADLLSFGQLVLALVAMASVGWGGYVAHQVGREMLLADRLVSVLSSRIPEDLEVSDLGLTSREFGVLDQMCTGNVSNAEIAAGMSVSPATAGTHVRNILRKAGLKSRRDLMLLATQELVEPGARR